MSPTRTHPRHTSIAFDLNKRCYRRQLSYFSKDGEQIQA